MSNQNPFSGLPHKVARRSEELHKAGLSPKRAIGMAVSDLEFKADWEIEDIANVLGVEEVTIRSNRSKAREEIDKAARLLVLGAGGSTTILSEYEPARPHHPFERWFVVGEFIGSHDYDEATTGDSRIYLIKVIGGSNGGNPSGNLEMSSTLFPSLESLASEKYIDQEFGSIGEANKWYSLLIDAGMSEEQLARPGEKLPDSHPDSSNHFNYQMRSLEGAEERRPPGRGR